MLVSITRLRIGIFLIALATLVLELSLVRVFDVILTPNMGYAVITAAVFALGLGGIYLYLFPVDSEEKVLALMPKLLMAFCITTLVLKPTIDWLPFDLNGGGTLLRQVLAWVGMYLVLVLPFFIAGILLSLILTHYSEQVHSLYFFDLIGAGLGCLIVVPLLTPYGPGGIQFVVAGITLIAAAIFSRRVLAMALMLVVAFGLIVYPSAREEYIEYRGHANKRNVDDWTEQGLRDFVRWDPVSKVEVFRANPTALNFALDGGQQGSWLIEFDGDYSAFDQEMANNPDIFYFGMNSLVHYLRRGTEPDVLIIGAAAGGETKAAVVFKAKHVDAIELVGEMVDAASTLYSEYGGGIFSHPSVNYRVGEGRTFLRGSDKKYDVIQMFSNHTSSSMADGSGAVTAAYLQTVEAYKEYFTHLADDGIMQINHHVYPRMLTTAAEAWRQMGREEFSRHVVVLERWRTDTLPTTLIKMQPWLPGEVEAARQYMIRDTTFVSGGIPGENIPSDPIASRTPYHGEFVVNQDRLDSFTFWLGTYGQVSLQDDVLVKLSRGGNLLESFTLDGKNVTDNGPNTLLLTNQIETTRGERLEIEVSSTNLGEENRFVLWLDRAGAPYIDMRGTPAPFVLAFDPFNAAGNLIPNELLDTPFPSQAIPGLEYKLEPVTDNNPYFAMIRNKFEPVSVANSVMMDGGTAGFLNDQLRNVLSAEWLSLYIVGTVSVIFSAVFIFLPLFFSHHGRARWPSMASYLVFFSCLGAGFIMVELVFVQLFKKLIGYPIHTYATVIFALLVSAGTGSLLTKKLRVDEDGRWYWVFLSIVAYGALVTIFSSSLFNLFLGSSISIRILVATLLLLPLGFVMGMPLPMAVSRLGRIEPRGIPWAWGMNGFFTVFGGFLSVTLSFLMGFKFVLVIGFAIYLIALWMFARIRQA
ncbi:MAG: hypothetical protein P8J68_07335 [Arenicellaceae bacterium]|nr:hypothetical protein [Arenicellaceae bacterium]